MCSYLHTNSRVCLVQISYVYSHIIIVTTLQYYEYSVAYTTKFIYGSLTTRQEKRSLEVIKLHNNYDNFSYVAS